MNDIATLGPLLAAGIKAYGEDSTRSRQSAEGKVGASNLGWCRQYSLLMLKGVEPTDSVNIWAAQVGTAIHEYIAKALKGFFPDWVIEGERLTATFPSGYTVPGTPDLIAPDYNAVVDVKSLDGFERITKLGPSQNNRFQRATYALAAIQAGLLDSNHPVFVANYYVDRSARNPEPYFLWEQFDVAVLEEADEWQSDVHYAHRQGEDASRDIDAVICARICDRFSACRGGLPMREEPRLHGPELIAAAELVYEGRELAKRAKRMVDEGLDSLVGVDGVAGDLQIRHVQINGRNGSYTRCDVTDVGGK